MTRDTHAQEPAERPGRRAKAAAGTSLFFALAPGVVAGVIPWWISGWEVSQPPWPLAVRGAGLVLLAAAMVVLIHSFIRFVWEGIGTPAPAAPTQNLVVGGLYRYVRNPMYLAVAAAITGQALWLGRPVLLAYAAGITLANAAFVHWYEEPTLARQFGSQYVAYRQAVPGWRPRLHPWSPRR